MTTENEALRKALEAMMDGSEYKSIGGDAPSWHRISMPKREALEMARLALSTPPAPAAAAVPDGWKLVPVEPTDAMNLAGFDSLTPGTPIHDDADKCWSAMLAAAPAAPAEEAKYQWTAEEKARLRAVLGEVFEWDAPQPSASGAPQLALGWIPVAECLPSFDMGENGERVLVLTADHDFDGVQVHDIPASDFHLRDDDRPDDIGTEVTQVATHWMPRHAALHPSASGAQGMTDAANRALRLLRRFKWLADSMKYFQYSLGSLQDVHEVIAALEAHPAPTAASIYAAIQHGDERHREWLRTALDAVFAGRAVPACDQTAPTAAQGLTNEDWETVRSCLTVVAWRTKQEAIGQDAESRVQLMAQAQNMRRIAARLSPVSQEDATDAARYRWLRAQPNDTSAPRIDVVQWVAADESANEGEGVRMEALDAAIDAAMSRQESGDE